MLALFLPAPAGSVMGYIMMHHQHAKHIQSTHADPTVVFTKQAAGTPGPRLLHGWSQFFHAAAATDVTYEQLLYAPSGYD